MHYLTDAGRNLVLAQYIYGALYVATLGLSCAIYRRAGVPNWVIVLLPLSKRLHSIYFLRLFNDCWSVFAMDLSILAYQRGMDDLGTLLFGYVSLLVPSMSQSHWLIGLHQPSALRQNVRYIVPPRNRCHLV